MDVIQTAHKLTYQTNVELALQQLRSKYADAMMFHPGLSGRQKCMLELFAATNPIINGPRGGDTPNIDSNVEPVWMAPYQVIWGKMIEKEDEVKALTDYRSIFVQNGAASIQRGRDQISARGVDGIGGFFGARNIGQDGLTVVAWAGDTVTIGVGAAIGPPPDDTTATGMNVRKLIRGVRLLQQRQVDIDTEQLFASINAQGMEELYRDITFVNTDWRNRSVLEGRQVREIMGITIIVADGSSSALPDFDATTYTFALWCKSGMHYGDFDGIVTKAEPNPAKQYRLHPFIETWFGSTRSEDFKVVKILSKK